MLRYRYIAIGALLGTLVGVVLTVGQQCDFLLYLSMAPYYIDTITIKTDALISPITYAYFIVLFSFIGYLVSTNIPKRYLFIIIIVVIVFHVLLVSRGGRAYFGPFFDLLNELSKTGIAIE